MERRKRDRVKRRLTCELVCEDQRASGIVLDVSPTGLFVQTGVKLARETEVLLRILGSEDSEPVEVRTRVARRRNAPQQLASVSSSGIGLEILHAPDAYYRQLDMERPSGAADPDRTAPASDAALQRFRVRVRHSESNRSRTLSVEAPDAESARDRALEKVGDDWEILDSEAA